MSELLRSEAPLTGDNPAFGDWDKSSYSQTSNCVEVAGDNPDGIVGIRDSKNIEGPMLAIPRAAYLGFIAGVRSGELAPLD